MVKMGRDFDYIGDGASINLLNTDKYVFNNSTQDVKIFDGAHDSLPEIRPLSVNSDWVLAIDYKFLLTPNMYYSGKNEFVLASCY
jgi:hypothetical protein